MIIINPENQFSTCADIEKTVYINRGLAIMFNTLFGPSNFYFVIYVTACDATVTPCLLALDWIRQKMFPGNQVTHD